LDDKIRRGDAENAEKSAEKTGAERRKAESESAEEAEKGSGWGRGLVHG